MIIEIETEKYDNKIYGIPIIRRFIFNEKGLQAIKEGEFLGNPGEEGLLRIVCDENDILGIGNKKISNPHNLCNFSMRYCYVSNCNYKVEPINKESKLLDFFMDATDISELFGLYKEMKDWRERTHEKHFFDEIQMIKVNSKGQLLDYKGKLKGDIK